MNLQLTEEDVGVLRTLPVCQPYRGTGAQYLLVPARYRLFFEPLLTVSIDGECSHGATLTPIDPRTRVLEIAREHRDKPFACMARPRDAPSEFSCSTFTTFVFGCVGIHLDRYASNQSYQGSPVAVEEALPGHLLFYGGDYAPIDSDRAISHVAIKSCSNRIIHGSSTRGKIVEHRYQDRKVEMAKDPYPVGPQLLLVLPRMIEDINTAHELVRYWQRKELGR